MRARAEPNHAVFSIPVSVLSTAWRLPHGEIQSSKPAASEAVAVLLLMNGARVDGGAGDDAADDAGLMEGEVLPAVLAALKAGCGIEGPVMGALRNSAGLQGTLFNVPPSW